MKKIIIILILSFSVNASVDNFELGSGISMHNLSVGLYSIFGAIGLAWVYWVMSSLLKEYINEENEDKKSEMLFTSIRAVIVLIISIVIFYLLVF